MPLYRAGSRNYIDTCNDLTEQALRTVLFGERNPLASQHMEFATKLDDPLEFLRNNPVSEEILRPLTELFIADLLVGSGRAARIVEFRLGLAIHGIRSLTISWETPRRYANQPTAVRTIKGNVRL